MKVSWIGPAIRIAYFIVANLFGTYLGSPSTSLALSLRVGIKIAPTFLTPFPDVDANQ